MPADEARSMLEDSKHKLVVSADAVLVLYDQSAPLSVSFAKECVGALTNKGIPAVVAGTKQDAAGPAPVCCTDWRENVCLPACRLARRRSCRSTRSRSLFP